MKNLKHLYSKIVIILPILLMFEGFFKQAAKRCHS
jgi:hypothetical protein